MVDKKKCQAPNKEGKEKKCQAPKDVIELPDERSDMQISEDEYDAMNDELIN